MQVFSEGAYPPDAPRAAVTVGVYDGVHKGHRHVLSRLHLHAADRGLTTVVVTFDPHPAAVVAPDRAPRLLTTFDRRLELLAATGVDRCVVVGFDPQRSTQSPASFVERVLVEELRADVVVVGENFRFGHNREGDVRLLAAIADRDGFEVEPVSLDDADGTPISSTRVRELVTLGDVAAAAELLGRPHELDGHVARGDGRGRELGFPTANLAIAGPMCVPAVGIYAGVWTRPGGDRHPAAVSIGRRPTFYDDAEVLVEAHLLDVDEDLYGEAARLEFVARLRDEEKYDSVDELVRQIRSDVATVAAMLS